MWYNVLEMLKLIDTNAFIFMLFVCLAGLARIAFFVFLFFFVLFSKFRQKCMFVYFLVCLAVFFV